MPVRLNTPRFDELVARTGLTYGEIAREAKVSPVTLSLARHGRPIRLVTLRALAAALTRVQALPELEGLVVGVPIKNKKAAKEREQDGATPEMKEALHAASPARRA